MYAYYLWVEALEFYGVLGVFTDPETMLAATI
jgi:hypothetical protein